MVLQDYRNAVFPWLTVKENIVLGRKKPIKRYNDFKYDEIVDLLGVKDILNTYPNQLSGGQIQRVQIGRALYTGCKYIILDEPTSSLDMRFRNDIQRVMVDLKKLHNIGSLLITHNIDEAVMVSDCIGILVEGEGKVVEINMFNGYSAESINVNEAHNDKKYRDLYEKVYGHIFA